MKTFQLKTQSEEDLKPINVKITKKRHKKLCKELELYQMALPDVGDKNIQWKKFYLVTKSGEPRTPCSLKYKFNKLEYVHRMIDNELVPNDVILRLNPDIQLKTYD